MTAEGSHIGRIMKGTEYSFNARSCIPPARWSLITTLPNAGVSLQVYLSWSIFPPTKLCPHCPHVSRSKNTTPFRYASTKLHDVNPRRSSIDLQ